MGAIGCIVLIVCCPRPGRSGLQDLSSKAFFTQFDLCMIVPSLSWHTSAHNCGFQHFVQRPSSGCTNTHDRYTYAVWNCLPKALTPFTLKGLCIGLWRAFADFEYFIFDELSDNFSRFKQSLSWFYKALFFLIQVNVKLTYIGAYIAKVPQNNLAWNELTQLFSPLCRL